MAYLVAVPELLSSAARDLFGIGAALGAANAAAAVPTTEILAAAEDEVSAAVASLFAGNARQYQALSAQVDALHQQFVESLAASSGFYAAAELDNANPLQQAALNLINAPTRTLLGRPLIGNGADGTPGTGEDGRPGGLLYGNGGNGASGAAGQAGGDGGSAGLIGNGGAGGQGGIGGQAGAGATVGAPGGRGGNGGLLWGDGGNGGTGGSGPNPGPGGAGGAGGQLAGHAGATGAQGAKVNGPSDPGSPGDPGGPSQPPGQNAVDAARDGDLASSNGGTITNGDLEEISGIDAGINNPNVHWVHNDSGDSARIFAIDSTTGQTLGTYNLGGATAVDWEDIEVAKGPDGKSYIYVGDIGDNGHSRSDVVIYRVPEPIVTGTASSPTNTTLTGVERLRVTYPNGERINSESLAVDPRTGNVMLVEKTDADVSRVYVAPVSAWGGSADTTLQQVATLDLSDAHSQLTTSADYSADGSQLVVRTYDDVLLWNRAEGSSAWSPFSQQPVDGPLVDEQQGEAIAFHPDGTGYVTVSEGSNQTLHNYGPRTT
ncbi:PE family protein [Mycobacterium riyadhense]|uniref:PE-PGRS family protein n=1 Tax=Mycobacterium riyadhense TaxID=486698 RepID=A0A1X2CW71_9MYCO|nr:PE family protein [Mycobacterium riyadhense]MCV7145297.1 PE family protein [Mycobacterium riyadhense]ORW80138.1 PE-PGRS family protein [Mycobacterium riyadhense]